MRHWRLLPGLLAASLIGLLVVYAAFYFIFLELFVDLWWFRSLQLEGYFWLRLLYRFFISGGITLIFFLMLFANFWVASRYLGFNIPPEHLENPRERRRLQRLFDLFASGSLRFYTPLSLLLAVIVALPFYHQWEAALLFLFGPSAGIEEPVYGNDVSFYMFAYPMFQLIQRELLVTATILFLGVGFLYWMEHRLLSRVVREYPRGAKIHVTVLVTFIFLLVAWGFMLNRFSLLYTDVHEPVFSGPGFVELRYHLPLIWTAMGSFLLASVGLTAMIHTRGRRGKSVMIFFGLVFLAAVGLRQVQFIPNLVNQYVVAPNPVKTEGRFMGYNIKATLDDYDLSHTLTVDFQMSLDPAKDLAAGVAEDHLKNIPLWDREVLEDVYRQLQGIRTYYTFPNVDEDRYLVNGSTQQVNIAAREMNISLLPDEAQNWENKHLRYTHGYGAVITPAAQRAGEPIDWYLRDLVLNSQVGFSVEKPDIYYGLEDYPYAIVPNKLTIPGISTTEPETVREYVGRGGVPIPSLFRKLLFAFYFKEQRIFFSLNITRDSRMLMRRNIVERISRLAPYLALDGDPYLVAGRDGFFWIQDAYTTSHWYPVSKRSKANFINGKGEEERTFNYIRNSVKIVTDAYDGAVYFYVADPQDPIIRAFQRAYPGIFRSMARMPQELKSHLRYARDLMYHQMAVYGKYHQREPALFYQQAETWEFSAVEENIIKPYYLTTVLPPCADLERFVLVTPMTPIRRANLSSLVVAAPTNLEECGDDYATAIQAFKIRKDIQVNGPAQVSALIDQDPEISAQWTLWDQHGSRVTKGRMIVLPMGNSMIYVVPIYMISSHIRIPQMVRVIVSVGDRVVMERSLEKAFERLRTIFLEEEVMELRPALPPEAEPLIDTGEPPEEVNP